MSQQDTQLNETKFEITMTMKWEYYPTYAYSLEEVKMSPVVVKVPHILHASCLNDTHDGDGYQWTKENDELKYIGPNDRFYSALKLERKNIVLNVKIAPSFKGTGHYWLLLTKIVSIKTYLVMSNEGLLIV